MRRKSILSIVLAMMIILTMVIGNTSIYAKAETKRQIIVFDENVDNNRKTTEILDKYKATKIMDIKGTSAVVVSVSSYNSNFEESDVRFVEEDFVISIEGIANKKVKDSDDNISDQPNEVVPWGVEYMNDWTSDCTNIGEGIKVGIIDIGIDVDHPDLVDNIKGGYNATSKKKSYDDDNGHGTHVAGIIAIVFVL